MLKAIGYSEQDLKFKLFDTKTQKHLFKTIDEVKAIIKSGTRIKGIRETDSNPMFTVHGLQVELEYPTRIKVGKWNVAVLYPGDAYGRSLTSTVNDLTVFFYDSSVNWNRGEYPLGQFVASYYVRTILDCTAGLRLDGGVPAWTVSAEEMQKIIKWLKKDIIG